MRQYIKSCQSCQHHYKNKTDNVHMCRRFQQIETKPHVNQNGHIRNVVTSVFGHTPCAQQKMYDGANKCRDGYKRNLNKPLEVRIYS